MQTESTQKTLNSSPKDLTSTLMNKNMASMSSSNSMQQGFQNLSQNSFMSTGMQMSQPPRSNSFGNMENQAPHYGSPMNSGFGTPQNSSMMPLNNRPAIMPPATNNSFPTSTGLGFSNGAMLQNNMRPPTSGGWTLQNPMTPQGMTPMMSAGQTNQSQTGAKKLSAAELADFLG